MFIALLLIVAVAIVLALATRLVRVSDGRAQHRAWQRIADAREAIARARDALEADTAALLETPSWSCRCCGATNPGGRHVVIDGGAVGAVHPAP